MFVIIVTPFPYLLILARRLGLLLQLRVNHPPYNITKKPSGLQKRCSMSLIMSCTEKTGHLRLFTMQNIENSSKILSLVSLMWCKISLNGTEMAYIEDTINYINEEISSSGHFCYIKKSSSITSLLKKMGWGRYSFSD